MARGHDGPGIGGMKHDSEIGMQSPAMLRRDRRQPPGRGIAVGEALYPRGTVD